MTKLENGFTRRRFLELVGTAGGSAAVYETMTALGLINMPTAWNGPPQFPARAGRGTSVLVLGAGIGGLTTAFLLQQYGFQVEILEAQERPGGRSLTARRGTVITEKNPDTGKLDVQECKFDQGLYLNMGPGRIPYHHERVLYFCRELKVPLEVYVMETTSNLFQSSKLMGGKAMPRRRIYSDTQGYIAELLAKAIDARSLDARLNQDDYEKLRCLLKNFGDLGEGDECAVCASRHKECAECASSSCGVCDKCRASCPACFTYDGSTRSGCAWPMQAGSGQRPIPVCSPATDRDCSSPCLDVFESCEPFPKLGLTELLRSEFWLHHFYQALEFEWQPTLFQPVGGMDKIVEGFTRRLGSKLIKYQCQVLDIQLLGDGVSVTYLDKASNKKLTRRADYCVGNIPMPVLKDISNNFSDEFKKAIAATEFEAACKVGWQANRRFWESDCQIYGGISYTDDMITQVWYPSNDYFTGKGTLTGAYIYEPQSLAFGRMGLKERLEVARRGGAKFHRQLEDNQIVPIELGLSIAWKNVPYQLGGWANWNPSNQEHNAAYRRLLRPDGRFFVVGDQASTLPGWQEGAMMSAEHVVRQVVPQVMPAAAKVAPVPETVQAPNARRVVRGR